MSLILSALIGGPLILTALVLWANERPAPEASKALPYARARYLQ